MKKADTPYLNGPQPGPMPTPKPAPQWSEVMHPQPWAPLVASGVGAGIGALAGGRSGALKGGLYGLALPPALTGGLWAGSRLGESVGMPGLGGLAGVVGSGYLAHKLIQHLTKDDEDEEKQAGYSSYIPGPEQKTPLKYQKNKGSLQPTALNRMGFPNDQKIDPKLLTKAQVIASAKKLYTDRLNGLLINEGNYKPNLADHVVKSDLSPEQKLKTLKWIQTNAASLERINAPHYMPRTNSIGVFGDNPAVLAHELGHAADFNEDKHWIRRASRKIPLYGNLRTEYVANRNAKDILNNIPGDEDKQNRINALRRSTLYPSYGTYLGGTAGGLLGLGAGVATTLSTGIPYMPLLGGVLGGAGGALLGGWAGRGLAGTVNNADWKKKQTQEN